MYCARPGCEQLQSTSIVKTGMNGAVLSRQGPQLEIFLVLLMFGSGCAALVYEIVWFQLLELIIGSTAVSLVVLLSVFMGGTCLGSMFAMAFAKRVGSVLRLYAALELAIAICGTTILTVLPHISGALIRFGGSHLAARGAGRGHAWARGLAFFGKMPFDVTRKRVRRARRPSGEAVGGRGGEGGEPGRRRAPESARKRRPGEDRVPRARRLEEVTEAD